MGVAAKSSAGRHGSPHAEALRSRRFDPASTRGYLAAEPFAEAPIRPSGAQRIETRRAA